MIITYLRVFIAKNPRQWQEVPILGYSKAKSRDGAALWRAQVSAHRHCFHATCWNYTGQVSKGLMSAHGVLPALKIQPAKRRNNSRQKNLICFVTNICIFTCKCVCLLTLGQISSRPHVSDSLRAPQCWWMTETCCVWSRQRNQEAIRLLCSQPSSEWTNRFGLTKMVFQRNEPLFDNNYFRRGLFGCFCCICLGLFLLVLHLGIKDLRAPAAEEEEPYRLQPSLQRGGFPPDKICFRKVPAEVNTSLTYSTSSLRGISVIF